MSLQEISSQGIRIFGMRFEPTESRRIRIPKGVRLRSQIEGPLSAHVIESGIVCASMPIDLARSFALRLYGPGDILETDQLLGCATHAAKITVLVPGIVSRVSFDGIQRALDQDRDFRHAVFQWLGTRASETELLAVCNRIHTLEQRLARQLLLLSHLTPMSALPLTQEELAMLLGVRRSSIVIAAGALRDKELIQFRRGLIAILDKERLEASACECYRALRRLHSTSRSNSLEDSVRRQVA